MNASALTKQYTALTSKERFRLIAAANARGDQAEAERLVNAGQHITLRMYDHAPFSLAFDDLARLMFLDLAEFAASYLDAFRLAQDAGDELEDNAAAAAEQGRGAEAGNTTDVAAEGPIPQQRAWERLVDQTLALGFLLKTQAEGWKRFCERLSIPPFASWNALPGFDRLQGALELTERVAFVRQGMLRWLRENQPAGRPAVPEAGLISPELWASAIEASYRQLVACWGG
jgi:hypothetical protein